MIEQLIAYVTYSPGRIVLISVSFILAVAAWIKLYRARDHMFLRVLAMPLPLLPILGPLMIFWIFNMPPIQPRHLRQNRWNHYGKTEFGNDGNDSTYSIYDGGKKGRKKAKSVHASKYKRPWQITTIIVIGFLAMNIMMYGLNAIHNGSWNYYNWWGGLVFGPVAVIIGLLLIVWLIKISNEQ